MVDELLFKRMKEAQGSKSHRKLTEAFEKAQWRKVQQKTVIQAKEGDTQARESQGKLAEAAKKAATSKER